MKKISFYALLFVCVLWGFLPLRAATVSPYKESFDNLPLDPPEDFKPDRWDRIVDSWESWDGSAKYVNYENPTTGGVNGGAYLKADQQEYYSSGWVDANDILITPALTGTVSFHLLKTVSYYDPNVKIYIYTPNGEGDGYTQGALLKEYSTEITDEWTQFTLTVDPGTRLGFRLEYAGIDELQAASAEIELRKSIKINSATLTSETDTTADAGNRIKVAFDFAVTNNGDFDLTAGETGYSVSIINRSAGNQVVATRTLDFPLAMGETSAPLSIEAYADAGTEEGTLNFALRENLRGSTAGNASIKVLPYVAKLALLYPGKTDDISLPIEFGIVADKASQPLRITNDGGAPLNITAIGLPEGYSTDVELPLTVGPKSEKAFTLSLAAGTPGDKAGNITFTADGLEEKAYALAGMTAEAGIWLENFEEGLPGNMIFGGDWSIAGSPAGFGAAGNTAWAENSNVSAQTKIISPLLEVQDGDVLTFLAARQNYQTTLNIYYSADRTDWHLAKTISGYNDGENEFTSERDPKVEYNNEAFLLKRFTVSEIPAGKWYIAFESGNVRLDDIYGYRLAVAAHDWYVTASSLPDKATVNNAYTASITASNLNSVSEAAGTYTATLYVDGKAAAEAEAAEWAASESKTFTFTYTPHEAGEYTAYMEIATSGYAVKTKETTLTVGKEMAVDEITVGNATGTGNGVFNLGYTNSGSETIYTADRLGLGNNASITSLAFMGKSTANVPDVHITVWMENTTDTKYTSTTPCNTDDMTLVYDGVLQIDKQGSSEEYAPVIDLTLEKPFVYEGGSLRIATMAAIPTWSYSVDFAVESNAGDISINYADDYEADRKRVSWGWSSSLPVIRLTSEKDVFTLSGKVTDSDRAAVADAVVTLTSGEVIYQSTTDAEGQYSIDVFQPEKEYTLTVAKEGYATASAEGLSLAEGNVVKDITLASDPATGLDPVSAATAVFVSEGQLHIASPAAGEAAVYSLTGMLVGRSPVNAGDNTFTLPAGSYVVKVNGKAYKVINK